MITVSKDNTGDYASIQEAVDAISSSTVSETIFIKNGTYNERVEITHNNITLIGESMDNVIITNCRKPFLQVHLSDFLLTNVQPSTCG